MPSQPHQRSAQAPTREMSLKLLERNPFRVLASWPSARAEQIVPPGILHASTSLSQMQSVVLKRTNAQNQHRVATHRVPIPKGRGSGRKKGDVRRLPNLTSSFRESRKLTKQVIDTTLWNFYHRSKLKSDNTFAMMQQLSCLLVGTVFQTRYVYHATIPYIGTLPGYCRVQRQPNFASIRLLIKQILHCRSTAPLERIVHVINSRG